MTFVLAWATPKIACIAACDRFFAYEGDRPAKLLPSMIRNGHRKVRPIPRGWVAGGGDAQYTHLACRATEHAPDPIAALRSFANETDASAEVRKWTRFYLVTRAGVELVDWRGDIRHRTQSPTALWVPDGLTRAELARIFEPYTRRLVADRSTAAVRRATGELWRHVYERTGPDGIVGPCVEFGFLRRGSDPEYFPHEHYSTLEALR